MSESDATAIAKAERDLANVEREEARFTIYVQQVSANIAKSKTEAQAKVDVAKKTAFTNAKVDPEKFDIDDDTVQFRSKPEKK